MVFGFSPEQIAFTVAAAIVPCAVACWICSARVAAIRADVQRHAVAADGRESRLLARFDAVLKSVEALRRAVMADRDSDP